MVIIPEPPLFAYSSIGRSGIRAWVRGFAKYITKRNDRRTSHFLAEKTSRNNTDNLLNASWNNTNKVPDVNLRNMLCRKTMVASENINFAMLYKKIEFVNRGHILSCAKPLTVLWDKLFLYEGVCNPNGSGHLIMMDCRMRRLTRLDALK